MDPEEMSESFELAVPFVTVQSNGGPHEDEAYVCGFEMGQLDSRLSQLAAFMDNFDTALHTVNRPQADLIAMRYGFTAEFEECGEDSEWSHVKFSRGGEQHAGCD